MRNRQASDPRITPLAPAPQPPPPPEIPPAPPLALTIDKDYELITALLLEDGSGPGSAPPTPPPPGGVVINGSEPAVRVAAKIIPLPVPSALLVLLDRALPVVKTTGGQSVIAVGR